LQDQNALKSGISANGAIFKDFSMGVDIVSTPAKNWDRPFANPGVLRGYFCYDLLVPESGRNLWGRSAF
jgi:hypothetical protein